MDPLTIGGILVAITTGAKFLKDSTQIVAEISQNGAEIVENVTSAYDRLKSFFTKDNKINESAFGLLESNPSDEDSQKFIENKIEKALDDETARSSELAEIIDQIKKAIDRIPENSQKEIQKTVGLDLRESKNAFVNYESVIAKKGATAIDARKSEGAKFEGKKLEADSEGND